MARHYERHVVFFCTDSLTHLGILIRDLLVDHRVVPQSRQPESGNTLSLLSILIDFSDPRLLFLIIFIIVRVSGLSSGDFFIGRFSFAVDNFGTTSVKRSVSSGEL